MGHQVGSIQPVEQPKHEEKFSPKLISEISKLRAQRFEWGKLAAVYNVPKRS